ncbi:DUF6520 family protein [Flavivirga rizhaonensis]|uniref:Uncharacterized protein n=1 Tax=Flavivirga rizhaonensis TaxID=2559571 RepID=A0A4S1DZL4_9FLAO|nr:DUF6520 family protein [Flavivirga rizhaonensis]TGV03609.1 hypothetical protein EM932_06170 [Flavivirga rizhaonensis]
MKLKMFKVILPVVVFIFASALCSFTVNSDIPRVAYYDDPNIAGVQEVTITCLTCSITGTGDLCKIQVGPFHYQLYSTSDLDLVQNNELKLIVN